MLIILIVLTCTGYIYLPPHIHLTRFCKYIFPESPISYEGLYNCLIGQYLVMFQFILRDILQFDYSLQGALDRIEKEKRTCDLILGVGDAKVCCAVVLLVT